MLDVARQSWHRPSIARKSGEHKWGEQKSGEQRWGGELHCFGKRNANKKKKKETAPSFRVFGGATIGSAMAIPALLPLYQIPPWLLGIAVLAGIWLLKGLLEWLQMLDRGVGFATPVFLEDPTSLEKLPCPSLFDPAEKCISLVMPAYNEENRLGSTLDETLRYLQARSNADKSFTYEIIVVDDGSKDDTVKVAYDYVKKYKIDRVRVIKQGVNCGKGAAVTKGVLCSRGELILMLDADGATKITDLQKLEDTLVAVADKTFKHAAVTSIADVPVVVCGSRAHLEEKALAQRRWYRNLLTKGFHLLVFFAARTNVRDTQCGFKLFTRAAARQLFINLRLKRWCFDVELLYLCKVLGVPVAEVAVTWTEIPGSKVNATSIIHMFFELVMIRLGYGFRLWQINGNLRQQA